MADKWQVELFLERFFRCWPPKCYVAPRDKNNEFLLETGLTPKHRQQVILGLTFRDYVGGPKPDRDREGEDIWEFGKTMAGIDVYIKLKIFSANKEQFAKCISFHKAEVPLQYQLK